MELFEYLAFREELIDRWADRIESVPEQALVGQYLNGNAESPPNIDFVAHIEALDHRVDEWDMSGIIKQFPDRVTTDNQPTDYYYYIVAELAKLKRNELREFKRRFQLSMEKCRTNEFMKPYRIAIPRTNCGFVFIPLEKKFIEVRQQGLRNLTYACKYDLQLPKCIGVSFAPEEGGWFSVEWCYMDFPWKYDAKFHQHLKDSNPFREVSTMELSRYSYRGNDEAL